MVAPGSSGRLAQQVPVRLVTEARSAPAFLLEKMALLALFEYVFESEDSEWLVDQFSWNQRALLPLTASGTLAQSGCECGCQTEPRSLVVPARALSNHRCAWKHPAAEWSAEVALAPSTLAQWARSLACGLAL